MKTVSIFLSLINSLLAGIILLASLTAREINDAALLWLLTKILTSIGVISAGVLTWLGIVNASKSSWVVLSNLGLIIIGTATFVWTFHLATISGDMEYYMAVYGISLIIQGLASLFGMTENSNYPLPQNHPNSQ